MVEAAHENYHGRGLEVLKFPDGGILFRTMDICLVAGISGRDGGNWGCYLNLDTAISIAEPRDKDFAAWLAEKFADYDSATATNGSCIEERTPTRAVDVSEVKGLLL